MIKHTLAISLTIFITGCSVANLDVSHNQEKKITYLDLGTDKIYVIPNSKKLISKNSSSSINRSSESLDSFTSNGICDRFVLSKLPPLGRNQYYTTQAKYDIYSSYGKSNCSTEEINGLEFHDCNFAFAITYDSSNDEGFLTEKRYLRTRSEQCFEDIKSYVRGSLSSDIVSNKKTYLDFSYSGVFTTITPEKEKCVDGTFGAKIVDKNLNGAFYYKDEDFKNKKTSFGVEILPDNKFIFTSLNENFQIEGKISVDKKFIGGMYKNDGCSGAFEASRF